MRGTMFQAPLELSLETDGESWNQGQALQGTLKVNSHQSDSFSLDNLNITLALGNLKKLKGKDPQAFQLVEQVNMGKQEVPPEGLNAQAWKFELSPNSPVTTKKESLYLLFGTSEFLPDCGQLQLYINPHPVVQEFIKTFEIFFRFKLKEYKNKKGQVEAVLAPPAGSKEFSSLDSFNCLFSYTDDQLNIIYEYKLRVLATDEGGAKIDKKKKSIKAQLNHQDYMMSPDLIDSNYVKDHIASILEGVKSPKIF